MKYRMLDNGEAIIKEDEALTCVNGWRIFEYAFVGEYLNSPIRRRDDGKGKYVFIDQPVDPEDAEDVEFWRWGVGWVWGGCALRKDETYATLIWRKTRGVEKPETQAQTQEAENTLRTSFSLTLKDGIELTQPFNTEKEAMEAAELEAGRNDGKAVYVMRNVCIAKYQAAKIVNKTDYQGA